MDVVVAALIGWLVIGLLTALLVGRVIAFGSSPGRRLRQPVRFVRAYGVPPGWHSPLPSERGER